MKHSTPAITLLSIASLPLNGAALSGSDSVTSDYFGIASLTSSIAVVGASGNKPDLLNKNGAAYLFRSVPTLLGSVTQNVKLTASDGSFEDQFGAAVTSNVSATTGELRILVGAPKDDVGANTDAGSAYFFRPASNATGTLTQNAKLQPTSRGNSDNFGSSLALDSSPGMVALIGSPLVDFFGNSNRGAVYLFRYLSNVTGTINENAILYDTDGAINDHFGSSVALVNVSTLTSALAGADGDNFGRGSACYFHDISAADGVLTQSSKLTASDAATEDFFGKACGLSVHPNTGVRYAVLGAPGDDFPGNPDQGSAYLFRIPSTGAAANLTQNAKLTSSLGDVGELLGSSVSASGTTVLLGAPKIDAPGFACLYLGLDTLTGTVNESIRIWPSDGTANDQFGQSVALTGDNIAIGAPKGNGTNPASGKAYTASLSAITTLDTDSATRTIEMLNFRSRTDWTIGNIKSNMTVTLAANSSAEVPQSGTAIYLGRNTSANNNLLIVSGDIKNTRAISVGSGTNSGNELRVNRTLSADLITIRAGSILSGTQQINANLVITGSLRPGNSAVTTMALAGDLTWHYGSPWHFDLAAANASDRLNLVNPGSDFLKGVGAQPREFNFLGSSKVGTYTLVTWTGSTTFAASDFNAINLAPDLRATFAIVNKSLVATITPNFSPLEQWRQTHFGNPTNVGNGSDNVDADQDGTSNLLEYALGTLPNSAASRVLPISGFAGNRLTLRFTPMVISGLTYSIQTSTNLLNWSTLNLTGLAAETPFTWTDSVNMTPGIPRFARLRISY